MKVYHLGFDVLSLCCHSVFSLVTADLFFVYRLKLLHSSGLFFFSLLWGWSSPWQRCAIFVLQKLLLQIMMMFEAVLRFLFMQLKVVGPVAVLGGLLQIVTFMLLCGFLTMVWQWLHPNGDSDKATIYDCFEMETKHSYTLHCSCLEPNCQRVYLLVPFCPCHQPQWYRQIYYYTVFPKTIYKVIFLSSVLIRS